MSTYSKKPVPGFLDIDVLAAFSKEPEPLDYVLPGLTRGSVGAVISPGGVGKSFWALLASGALSDKVEPSCTGLGACPSGRAVVFCAEDGEAILSDRIRAQSLALMPGASVKERYRAFEHISLFSLKNRTMDIMDSDDFEELVAWALGTPTLAEQPLANAPRLIVLDTLARFHRKDENNAIDMAQVISRLELLAHRTRAAVVFLHHASKVSVLSKQASMQQAARGSSVIVDHSRWVSFLEQLPAEVGASLGLDERQAAHFVRWNISKQNYGPPIADVWYVRKDHGALVALDGTKSDQLSQAIRARLVSYGRGPAPRAVRAASSPRGSNLIAELADSEVNSSSSALNSASQKAQNTAPLKESVRATPAPSSARNAFEGQW